MTFASAFLKSGRFVHYEKRHLLHTLPQIIHILNLIVIFLWEKEKPRNLFPIAGLKSLL